jgi:hypothetical protein
MSCFAQEVVLVLNIHQDSTKWLLRKLILRQGDKEDGGDGKFEKA